MAAVASTTKPIFAEPFRFIKPTLPDLETVLTLYRPAFSDGLITNAKVVARFEDAVCEMLGVRHCVAVSSCTCGLTLVMKALGLKGQVVLPSFTFFVTGQAALWNGLEPVFAEIDPATWTLDPSDAEARITERTSAIIAVHMYGNAASVHDLEQIATRRGLKLIFDAAHAFGSSCCGRNVGQFGDAEVFSLSPTKLLVAGEGGLVCTNDATLAHMVRAGRNYGDLGAYDPVLLGLNARMAEFNAALGLAGLGLGSSKIKRHNEIAALYTSGLMGVPGIAFQRVPPEHVSTYKDYSVHIDASLFGMSRDEAARELSAQNIETKKYFDPPLHQQVLFRSFVRPGSSTLPITESIAGGILSLPIYESVPDESVESIARAIRNLAR